MANQVTVYIYRDVEYKTPEEVDEAITKRIGGFYNNVDVSSTVEFEYEWEDVRVITKSPDVAWGIVEDYTCKNCKPMV